MRTKHNIKCWETADEEKNRKFPNVQLAQQFLFVSYFVVRCVVSGRIWRVNGVNGDTAGLFPTSHHVISRSAIAFFCYFVSIKCHILNGTSSCKHYLWSKPTENALIQIKRCIWNSQHSNALRVQHLFIFSPIGIFSFDFFFSFVHWWRCCLQNISSHRVAVGSFRSRN